MKLIPNWRKGYKMLSVQAMSLSTAILGTWALLPDDLKAVLPTQVVIWVSVGLLVVGILGRFVDQPGVKDG